MIWTNPFNKLFVLNFAQGGYFLLGLIRMDHSQHNMDINKQQSGSNLVQFDFCLSSTSYVLFTILWYMQLQPFKCLVHPKWKFCHHISLVFQSCTTFLFFEKQDILNNVSVVFVLVHIMDVNWTQKLSSSKKNIKISAVVNKTFFFSFFLVNKAEKIKI